MAFADCTPGTPVSSIKFSSQALKVATHNDSRCMQHCTVEQHDTFQNTLHGLFMCVGSTYNATVIETLPLNLACVQGDGPGSGGIGAAISGGLNRKLSGAYSRRSSSDVTFHGRDVELARHVSSLPLLAFQEGQEFGSGSSRHENDRTADKVGTSPLCHWNSYPDACHASHK